jgi:hypothetical protein
MVGARITRGCLLALVLMVTRSQNVARAALEQGAQKGEDSIFDVQPPVSAPGETAVLRWSIKGATKVVVEEASGSKGELHKLSTFSGTGSLQVSPKENTTYVVSCEGSKTFSCASATVRVRIKRR